MVRFLLAASVAISLCLFALGQENSHGRLAPITAPIRHAGVYHVATGRWTRNASLANVTGPDTIYNNTCAAYYYAPMSNTESFQHRSRIPSPSGPTSPSIYYGPAENDEVPGCQTSYTVDGFQVGYCTSATTTIDWTYEFASSYAFCGLSDMVPNYTIVATGLPGGQPGGSQNCWVIDVDLSGTSGGGMVLSADGDGSYSGPSGVEQFGFSLTQSLPLATRTGPLVAGDVTFTGGPTTGSLNPCPGTDGTIWDNPINLSEPGTGMASNNFFRAAATPGPLSFSGGPGCYYFGGAPHADFWLKLYANAGCSTSAVVTGFCFPGEGGISACTGCSPANAPQLHGRGCDNYGRHSGGAQVSATGVASVSGDTIVLGAQYENDTALTVLMQGTAMTNHSFGAGVSCVAGTVLHLYTGSAGASTNGDPLGAIHRPGTDDPRSVHVASLAAGYDIGANAPVTLYYQSMYRDPNASAHCGGATFNLSAAGEIHWSP